MVCPPSWIKLGEIIMQLDDVVKLVIQDFVTNNVLFTALDVSNKVKESLPFARHREVRDLVRVLFSSDIEPATYAKTPINVSLADGSSVEAILYHPLADSWDLDAKYDAQKRNQTAVRPGQNVPAPVSVPAVTHSVPLATAASVQPSSPVAAVTPTPASPALPAAVQWQHLFGTQPSLFPRRP